MSDEKKEAPQLPSENRGLAREFMDFIIHEKAWWMTPIVIVLVLMVAFILSLITVLLPVVSSNPK